MSFRERNDEITYGNSTEGEHLAFETKNTSGDLSTEDLPTGTGIRLTKI